MREYKLVLFCLSFSLAGLGESFAVLGESFAGLGGFFPISLPFPLVLDNFNHGVLIHGHTSILICWLLPLLLPPFLLVLGIRLLLGRGCRGIVTEMACLVEALGEGCLHLCQQREVDIAIFRTSPLGSEHVPVLVSWKLFLDVRDSQSSRCKS